MTGLAETAMVHADLHVGNVLVSDDGTITLKVSVRRNTALAARGLRSPR
jgi:serine/threonine-protein kinase RIO1